MMKIIQLSLRLRSIVTSCKKLMSIMKMKKMNHHKMKKIYKLNMSITVNIIRM